MSENLTHTEKKILSVLSDGSAHRRKELFACLPDQAGDDKNLRTNIQQHISRLRRKLRPHGQDIICEIAESSVRYRHIRIIAR